MEQENITSLHEFFRVERRREESVKDYVSRFELMSRICIAVGMEDMKEEYKEGLLMTIAHLEE